MSAKRLSADEDVNSSTERSIVAPDNPNAARERDRVEHNRDPETDVSYWQAEAQEVGERLRNEAIGEIAADRLEDTVSNDLNDDEIRELGERIYSNADHEALPSSGAVIKDLVQNKGYSLDIEVSKQATHYIREQMVAQFSTDQLRTWVTEIVQGDDLDTD